mmetsp:Transcript_80666/g.130756  ORF Transcript_80666/g.130756 Transcript_80666/m.130756 type:complete len:428 (+) Transcript_80666:71-1354(+)
MPKDGKSAVKRDHPARKAVKADKGMLAFLQGREQHLAMWYDADYEQWRATSSPGLRSVVGSVAFRKMCTTVQRKDSAKVEVERQRIMARFNQPEDAFGKGPDLLGRSEMRLLLRAMNFSEMQREWRAGRAPQHMLKFKDLWLDTGELVATKRLKQAFSQEADYSFLDAAKSWKEKPEAARESVVGGENAQTEAMTLTRYIKFDMLMGSKTGAKQSSVLSSMSKNLLAASIGVALEWVDENHFETTEPSPGLIKFFNQLLATGRMHTFFLSPEDAEEDAKEESSGVSGCACLNEQQSLAVVNALIFPVWLYKKCSRNASMPANTLDFGADASCSREQLVIVHGQPGCLPQQGGTGGFIKWQAVERKKTAYAGMSSQDKAKKLGIIWGTLPSSEKEKWAPSPSAASSSGATNVLQCVCVLQCGYRGEGR